MRSLVDNLSVKLQSELGDNYQGLFSVAHYLILSYMDKWYRKDECDYIRHKISMMITPELAHFLVCNYELNRMKTFPFREAVEKAEEELLDLKLEILSKWRQGKLYKEAFELAVKYDTLTILEKMYYSFIRFWTKYDSSKEKEFKKELGL